MLRKHCHSYVVLLHHCSTWLSSFTLSVSLGAVFLLPMTILSNEILVCYPGSYYVKWLNVSLIQGKLWLHYVLTVNVLFSDRIMESCVPRVQWLFIHLNTICIFLQ